MSATLVSVLTWPANLDGADEEPLSVVERAVDWLGSPCEWTPCWAQMENTELLRMARGGNGRAQAALAWRLGFGRIPERDEQRARAWALASAGQDCPEGWAVLGWLLYAAGEYRRAADCFERASDGQAPLASAGLGLCLLRGEGRDVDVERGHRLLRAAAEKDEPWAAYWLGHCAYFGIGLEKDYEQAAVWLERAGRAGVAEAEDLFARCLFFGRGRPVDRRAAALHWQNAARAGVPSAQFAWGLCLLQGVGCRADPSAALPWLRSAARAGIVPAMQALARCLSQGRGCRPDPVAADHWYRRAAHAGKASPDS
ncbi:MAG: sel1 repeat family protein [Rhodocyclaceae bacterium]|nr:sel1 repeat family protein [Rhodocyclaceae bacterium]